MSSSGRSFGGVLTTHTNATGAGKELPRPLIIAPACVVNLQLGKTGDTSKGMREFM
jgi:hypothetical protein